MKTKWTPRPSDIQFARTMIQTMTEGGIWGIPRTGQVYRFDHSRKTLALISGEVDDLHECQIIVFGRIGWTVTDETQVHCWN